MDASGKIIGKASEVDSEVVRSDQDHVKLREI
jgi:hypothetical protein